MVNIIFLDVDGVLNNIDTITTTKSGWTFVDDFLVERLRTIVELTGAKVVLSSSWRYGMYSSGTDRQDYLELVDKLREFNIQVIDVTPIFSDGDREEEIMWWLEHRWFDSGHYVILDDVNYFVDLQTNFVQTSPETGLTLEDVERAIKILKGEAV